MEDDNLEVFECERYLIRIYLMDGDKLLYETMSLSPPAVGDTFKHNGQRYRVKSRVWEDMFELKIVLEQEQSAQETKMGMGNARES